MRRLHSYEGTVHAAGVFRVRHGTNVLARAIAQLANLPAAGESVDIRLQVTELEGGEEWRRMFAGHALVSAQSIRDGGLLAERMGLLELRFRLEVTDGSLKYQTMSVALSFGPALVPLPRSLSPRVTACEKAIADTDQIHVSVDVSLPLLGRLIAYDGMLTQVEEIR